MLTRLLELLLPVYRVRLYWESPAGDCSEYFVIGKRAAKRLVEASKRLHCDPGVNPHQDADSNGTSEIEQISVARLRREQAYWWSTPDLQKNNDRRGATIWNFRKVDELCWKAPHVPGSLKGVTIASGARIIHGGGSGGITHI